MTHPLDRPIGSDLSYFTLQRRAREGELPAAVADSVLRRLDPLPSHLVGRHEFVADRQSVITDQRELSQRFQG